MAKYLKSKAKLLELQPSWREPLEKSCLYKIIPGELELAVPGLLACLSRIGNASHDVYRQRTALQLCARIHSIIASQTASGKDIDETNTETIKPGDELKVIKKNEAA